MTKRRNETKKEKKCYVNEVNGKETNKNKDDYEQGEMMINKNRK